MNCLISGQFNWYQMQILNVFDANDDLFYSAMEYDVQKNNLYPRWRV